MGFVKDAAKAGTFGLAGLLASNKKKKDPLTRQPTMISSTASPTSMIGSSRGGY